MRDTFPDKMLPREMGIFNLDSSDEQGTYWVCYSKVKNKIY